MATKGIKASFRKDYWDVYYGHEEIMLKSLEELPGDEIGAKIDRRLDIPKTNI